MSNSKDVHTRESESRKQDLIDARRQKALEYAAVGYDYTDIARLLHVDISTVSRDFKELREQAKDRINSYVNEKLPLEYEKCLLAVDLTAKESWSIGSDPEVDPRTRIHALALFRECAIVKMDLMTHARAVESAMDFVDKAKKELAMNKKDGEILV